MQDEVLRRGQVPVGGDARQDVHAVPHLAGAALPGHDPGPEGLLAEKWAQFYFFVNNIVLLE